MSSIRSRAPSASSANTRKVMLANVGRDTKPEMQIRKLLFADGFRYRVNVRPEKDLRCKADIVFNKKRICIFIDGCFWHGCPIHFKLPKTNSEWWREKIDDNRERDARKTRELKERGWLVIRLWEHELNSTHFSRTYKRVKIHLANMT